MSNTSNGDPRGHRTVEPGRLPDLRLVAAATALVTLAAAVPAPWASPGLRAGASARPSDVAQAVLLTAASWLVWLLLLWFVVVGGLAGLTRLPGVIGRIAHRLCGWVTPVAARRLLIAAVGTSLLAGVTQPASAGPQPASGTADPHHSVALVAGGGRWTQAARVPGGLDQAAGSGVVAGAGIVRLTGSGRALAAPPDGSEPGTGRPRARTGVVSLGPATPVGQRPGDPPGHRPSNVPLGVQIDWPGGSGGSTPAGDDAVVVLRGDTLWAIAARHLPPGADDVHVDAAWRRWYTANRSVIGADPDLILPGQRLLPPPTG